MFGLPPLFPLALSVVYVEREEVGIGSPFAAVEAEKPKGVGGITSEMTWVLRSIDCVSVVSGSLEVGMSVVGVGDGLLKTAVGGREGSEEIDGVSVVLLSVVVEGDKDSEDPVVGPIESGRGKWGNDVDMSGAILACTPCGRFGGMGGGGAFGGGFGGGTVASAMENARRGSREQKKSVKAPEEWMGRGI